MNHLEVRLPSPSPHTTAPAERGREGTSGGGGGAGVCGDGEALPGDSYQKQ